MLVLAMEVHQCPPDFSQCSCCGRRSVDPRPIAALCLVMKALEAMKSEEAFVRRGRTIYELVGANDVLPEIRAGRALLLALPSD